MAPQSTTARKGSHRESRPQRSISRSKPISFKPNALSAMLSRKSYRSEVLQRMRLADGGQVSAMRRERQARRQILQRVRGAACRRRPEWIARPESTPLVRVLLEDGAATAAEGERKIVTALFADIKGSTELEQDLDPEEARAIIDPALKLMIDAVRRYDGYVVQSTGDGIFALFGAPVAHEDHPQRTLYAAIRMQEELRRYSTRLVADGGNPLQMPSRRQHRRSCRANDLDRRRARRVHANRAHHQPCLANAGGGAGRFDRGRGTHAQAMRGLFRAPAARSDQGQGRQRAGQRLRSDRPRTSAHAPAALGGRGLSKFVGREREMEALKRAAGAGQSWTRANSRRDG